MLAAAPALGDGLRSWVAERAPAPSAVPVRNGPIGPATAQDPPGAAPGAGTQADPPATGDRARDPAGSSGPGRSGDGPGGGDKSGPG